ncbi:PQQ-binding-like beta-propeller repeat protein [Sphingopyxis sp.]|uniref:outer membrane protein assembly factor BamB family protein n=1 Tax=Sphingopyxis sp. TaxID=1908224 RepID=UPI002DED4CA5|nr:PQQ-binding-like beta-propeller repeat protein [Sphingopyxis sp.]
MKFASFYLVILSVLLSSCGSNSHDPENSDWSVIGNGDRVQHHAEITQINKDTVGKLGLAWSVEMPTSYGLVGNPLIKDGVIFQAGPGGQAFANDLKTGKLLWQFTADYPEQSAMTASLSSNIARQANRGLALHKNLAILATGDCRLVALDQKTGKKRWEAQSCDASQQYGILAAPRVGGGMVFTGNTCADSGETRGFVDAFDADTGKHRWRFYTVPGDPATEKDPFYQDLAKSWGTDWYGKTHGCGNVWDAMVYDEKLDQLVIGVGGPSPASPAARASDAGDELFTNSVVALDVRTGKYKWHHKQVPHDAWNYEPAVGLMIAELPVEGKLRHTIVSVPKQGFAYVYDAETGKFLKGNKYVEMTWAKGLDRDGRPITIPDANYWERPGQETMILPSGLGSHGWEALAFNPETSTVYVPTMVMPATYKVQPGALVGGLAVDWYYGDRPESRVKTRGEVVAIDLAKNVIKWRTTTSTLPMNGGLLHTSGGLVFQGLADGRLVAFDDETGKIVWSRQTGGAIRGAPASVMLNGEQYIVVPTGNGAASISASLVYRYNSTPESRTPPRLLAFKIGGTAPYPPLAKPEATPVPSAQRQSVALAARGAALFEGLGCDVCHGTDGGASVGGAVPNLNRTPPANLDFLKLVVQQGALRANGMPQFKGVTDDDAAALYAHLVNSAWDAHDREQTNKKKKAK